MLDLNSYRHFTNDLRERVMLAKNPIYYGFDPKVVDTKDGRKVVIGHERIAHMVEDIYELHKEHFAETETLYLAEEDQILPDYTRYTELEARKQFVVFTIREAEDPKRMVGYLMYYVFRSLHVANVFEAREDAFFLTKDYRASGLAKPLLAFAEDALKALGCKYVGMSNKAPVGGPDIGGFLEKQGYRHVAQYYAKRLTE